MKTSMQHAREQHPTRWRRIGEKGQGALWIPPAKRRLPDYQPGPVIITKPAKK